VAAARFPLHVVQIANEVTLTTPAGRLEVPSPHERKPEVLDAAERGISY